MENINKIQIVPDEVYEIGADKAPVIPEWSVKDDETLRKKVDDLAHSTFDRSKFTVVGSPVITNDGIASGFSDSNYLTIAGLSFGSSVWEIQDEFVFASSSNNQAIFGPTSSASGPLLYISSTVMQLNIPSSVGTWGWQLLNGTHTFTAGNTYCYKIGWDGTNYYIKVSDDLGATWLTLQTMAGTAMLGGSGTFGLGIGRNPTYNNRPLTGSIDLKQFSITVDGVEVFSGNRTGIDTIKPDNYTVVGSPTISADGVASGFSSSNYINIPNTYAVTSTSNTEFNISISKTSNPSASSPFMRVAKNDYRGTFGFLLGITAAGYLYTSGIIERSHAQLDNNRLYNIKLKCVEGVASVYLDGDLLYSGTYTTDVPTGYITIGAGTGGDYFQNGSIDLNALKIYTDGNLVYQSCLKIPYTESQNYVKVVDKLYRDRVKDLFEQEGYNIYYTLGEDDFTLPSNKPNDIVKYKANGLTVAEQRADQTLTIRGACESGTDVNLPMDFFDADSYAVFGVGTTGTNTASKFTPAADGNYIAIGKGKV